MREVKFRAWDKENKIMLYHFLISSGGDVFIIKEPNTSWGDSGVEMIPTIDSVELMQYTGLKDRNGVEIYEGDIIKHWYVPYNTGGMGAKWKTELVIFGKELPCNTEVIGNIYENPGLLE